MDILFIHYITDTQIDLNDRFWFYFIVSHVYFLGSK